MKVVIGLVGEKGSGKETFFKLLQELLPNKTIEKISSSGFLAETLKLWDIPTSRINLQSLAIIMDKQYGDGSVTHALKKRMEQVNADIIIFDAVRWQTDAEMVKEFPNSLLIYITAPIKVRYERLKLRKEKVGEDTTSFEQFLEEEKVATELQIPTLGQKADFKITNDSSQEEMQKQVQKFISQFLTS